MTDNKQPRLFFENSVIRVQGDADRLFREEPVNILVVYRLIAQLMFEVDDDVYDAMLSCAECMKEIPDERIGQEISVILLSDPLVLFDMHRDKTLEYVFPELEAAFCCTQNNPYHAYDVGSHSIAVAGFLPATSEFRWTGILHDLGKVSTKTTDERGDHFYDHPKKSAEIAETIMARYKFADSFRKKVTELVLTHNKEFPTKRSIRRFVNKYSWETLQDHFEFRKADIAAHNPKYIGEMYEKLRSEFLLANAVKNEKQDKDRYSRLAIDGTDLLMCGIEEGPEIGELLERASVIVARHPELNTKEHLLYLLGFDSQ